MEKEGKSTRFCLVCNYISRIIDPITSRCAKFRFKSLSNDAIRTRLEMVCTEEKLQVKDEESMEALIESSEGDMRKAITTLQSCSRLNKVISKREIFEVRAEFQESGSTIFSKKLVHPDPSKNSTYSLKI